MERVKDYEEERVKEVKGKGAKDFKDCYVLSARRSIPGSILWDSSLQSTFKGGSAINCFCPPPNWRWLCKCPGSVFVQNLLKPRIAES